MKRIAILAVAVVLGTAFAQNLGGRTITVGTDPTNPPFESVNDQNQIVGFDVDLMNAICERVNCVAEFQSAHWDGLIPAVNAGAFDVLAAGMTITDERERQVDFSIPYESIGQAIVIKAGNENLTVQDFTQDGSDLVLGAVSLTTNAVLAEKLVGHDRLREDYSVDRLVQALLDGHVDGVVFDDVVADAFVRQYAGRLVVGIRRVKSGDEIGLAVAEGDPEALLQALDAGIKTLQEDGTAAALREKWF